MSDRIIQGFSEMKDIYLTQILTEEKEDEDYGEKFEKKYKKTGKKSKDYDGDEEVEDESDEYAGVKDKAIKDAMDEDEDEKPKKKRGKKKEKKEKDDDEDMKTESFSNWRTDLYEVISKLNPEPKVKNIGNEPITEKPNVNNKITLNPTVTEKFAVIDTQELSEDFIVESANIAADYFVSQGLNEHGLEMVIDYLGEEKFLEYVFYVTEDTLLTESELKQESSKSYIGRIIAIDEGNIVVESAVQQQSKGRTNKDKAAALILKTIKGFQDAHTRDKDARAALGKRISNAAIQIGVGATKAGRVAQEFGKGVSSGVKIASGMENTRGEQTPLGAKVAAGLNKKPTETRSFGSKRSQELAAKNSDAVAKAKQQIADKEAKNAANRAKRKAAKQQANESVHYIMEKAVSEQQQKIFGLALSVKRGEVSRSKVSDKVLEMVDGMSEAEIRKFASTKHKGLPHKKEE